MKRKENPVIYNWSHFATLASDIETASPTNKEVTCVSCKSVITFYAAFKMKNKYYCPICTGIEGTLLAIKKENRLIRTGEWIARIFIFSLIGVLIWLAIS